METTKGIENKMVGVEMRSPIPTPKGTEKPKVVAKGMRTYTVLEPFCGLEKGEKIKRDSSLLSVQKCVEQGLIG